MYSCPSHAVWLLFVRIMSARQHEYRWGVPTIAREGVYDAEPTLALACA